MCWCSVLISYGEANTKQKLLLIMEYYYQNIVREISVIYITKCTCTMYLLSAAAAVVVFN